MFLFVLPLPIFIIFFVVIAVGIRGGVNDVLGEHQFRFINLKVSEVLTIVGLGCCLLFLLGSLLVLVSNFVTVTAGVGGAIA